MPIPEGGHVQGAYDSSEQTIAYQGMVSTSIADNKDDVFPLSTDLITTELYDMQ